MADSGPIPVLWPDDISVDVFSPLDILRTQVAPLQKMTRGLLKVDLATTTSENAAEVIHTMDLVAPSLENYRYQVLSVSHDKDRVYPAVLEAHCFEDPGPEDPGFAVSEQRFIEILREVLQSQEVRSVIDSLLARMNEKAKAAFSGAAT